LVYLVECRFFITTRKNTFCEVSLPVAVDIESGKGVFPRSSLQVYEMGRGLPVKKVIPLSSPTLESCGETHNEGVATVDLHDLFGVYSRVGAEESWRSRGYTSWSYKGGRLEPFQRLLSIRQDGDANPSLGVVNGSWLQLTILLKTRLTLNRVQHLFRIRK
jgi:hypothetical protein